MLKSSIRKPRSYQGVVDETVRKCQFVQTQWSELPELFDFATRFIEPKFNVSVDVSPSDLVMLYSYGKGVGFLAHHDEVTAIELQRARQNGQPVMHGDITIIVFLNDGAEYEGGELFFPDHGVSLKPPVGSIVAFPATRECVHGVAPISKGNRLTSVARCFIGDRRGKSSHISVMMSSEDRAVATSAGQYAEMDDGH